MDIFEDERTVSRTDLAAWLRQVASQLETGQIFYGAAGTIAVADQVHCELEIEQEGRDEFSVEIEFSWINRAAAPAAEAPAEAATETPAETSAEAATEAGAETPAEARSEAGGETGEATEVGSDDAKSDEEPEVAASAAA